MQGLVQDNHREMRVRPGGDPVGTVLVVDRNRFSSFDQMAAALRRRGVRVVRVTPDVDTAARLIDRFCYDAACTYTTDESLVSLLRAFDDEDLLDVITIDELFRVVASVPWQRISPRALDRIRTRGEWVDKLVASRRLAAAGVRVPEVRDAAETTAAQAVAELGLPLVVKARIGAGGNGVVIARTLDEVEAAAIRFAHREPGFFYEAFQAGEQLCAGVAYDGDRIFDEAAYEPHHEVVGSVGPATRVVVRDDAPLLDAVRAAARAVGGSGLLNVDLVTSDDGPLVIDVNIRVWAASILLNCGDCRFDLGYLNALTGEDDGLPTRVGRRGAALRQFPNVALHEARTTGRLPLGKLLAHGRPLAAHTGRVYVVAAVAHTIRVWGIETHLGDTRLLRPLRSVVRLAQRVRRDRRMAA